MDPVLLAIRHMAKTLDERAENERQEPSTPATPTLLGIPPELRVRIFEYVVYHEEGGGVICPIHKPKTRNLMAKYHTNVVLRAGERWTIRNGQPIPLEPPDGTAIVETHEWLNAKLDLIDRWEILPTCQQHHFCTISCLQQPVLTKVSGQVRNEVSVSWDSV